MKKIIIASFILSSISSYASVECHNIELRQAVVNVCAEVVDETTDMITYEPTTNFKKDFFGKGSERICKAFGQGSEIKTTYFKSNNGTQLTRHGWYHESGLEFKVIDTVTCSKLE